LAHRKVAVAGATGLVGSHILQGLLDDASVAQVHALGRRAPAMQDAKLTVHVVDFRAIPPLPPLDEAYLALGTTIKQAGSREAFAAVDLDANLAVALAALRAGARRAGLVSAEGASARSAVFYSRIKGELEDALTALPLDALVIARPSLLVGDRAALLQPARFGESLANRLGAVLKPLLPARYRPVEAGRVACALLATVPTAEGTTILASDEIQRYRPALPVYSRN
jgi:uncharacterized protein YbjT (DUF2867 family)